MTRCARLGPLAAAVFSFCLSLCTMGSTVDWQDSGFYLVATHDLAVLYPPGFVLYELLCRAWTRAIFFVDFTLAVHLFSALCAAGAAFLMALATREFLGARSAKLRTGDAPVGPQDDLIASGMAVLMACAFTFWSSGITAKGYSFLYLVLAALLWRMLRAIETGRPSDLTWAAVLIGVAWQAHPSATCAGAALLIFAVAGRAGVGWTGIAWRGLLAAACALGPVALLPVLARRSSLIAFGDPGSAAGILEYLTGERFLGKEGAFSLGTDRAWVAARFFWEEWLVVPALLLGLGLVVLARRNRKLLGWILAWAVPYTVVPTLFTGEGQQDHWYVAAWLPFWGVAALGLREVAGRLGPRWTTVLLAAGAASAVGVNYRWVDRRGDDLAETLGRICLEIPSRNAILVTQSDDVTGSAFYLQSLKGVRPDVLIVRPAHLGLGTEAEPGWYDRLLKGRRPELGRPAYAETRARFPGVPFRDGATAAFANASVRPDRPVYFERPPPPVLLRPDYVLVPAGPLMKMVPKDRAAVDEADWTFPLRPEEVRPRFRRKRGSYLDESAEAPVSRQEPYEQRLFLALLRARLYLADWRFRHREFEAARDLYRSIVAADPETADLEEVVHPLSVSLAMTGRAGEAEPLLRRTLDVARTPARRAEALLHLGDLERARGAEPRAQAAYREALALPGLAPELREELEKRLATR